MDINNIYFEPKDLLTSLPFMNGAYSRLSGISLTFNPYSNNDSFYANDYYQWQEGWIKQDNILHNY